MPADQQEEALTRDERILAWREEVRLTAYGLRRACPPPLEVDDLISAGTIGLITALDRFDARLGVPEKAYLKHRMRGAMRDLIRAELGRTHRRVRAELETELHRLTCPRPSADALAERALLRRRVAVVGTLNAKQRAVWEALSTGRTLVSLQSELGLSSGRMSQLKSEVLDKLAA